MPLYHKSALAQKQLRELEPEMKQIKEEYVGDKQIQAQKIMELYQKHGINPFASFLLLKYFLYQKDLLSDLPI